MRKYLSIIFALIFLLSIIGASFADGQIMPLKDIRPGMKGYGLSVFQGTKIEKFPVTVLGLTKFFNPGLNTILIRIDGGYCVENNCGPVAGMSGSPVYVDGKLIGAVAYGYPFGKSTICGVQPIEDMLQTWKAEDRAQKTEDRNTNTKNAGQAADIKGQFNSKITVGGKEYKAVKIVNSPGEIKNNPTEGELLLTPLKSLILTSGLSAKSIEALNKEFSGTMTFKEGGGGLYYENEKFELIPGAAVGPVLVRGDISISSAGTLTYVKGNKFLAFGHPMFNTGLSGLPFSAFYVQTVVPAYDISFKVSSSIKEVGVMTGDDFTAVSGFFGKAAEMLPMTVNINDGGRSRKFFMEVAKIDHPIIPLIMRLAIEEAANTLLVGDGRGTVKADFVFTINDGTRIKYSDIYYSSSQPLALAQLQFYAILQAIGDNEFKKVDFKNVAVDINYARKDLSARIQKIYLEKNEIEPGGHTKLHIVIAPFEGDPFEKVVEVAVPASIQKGLIKIGVCGGAHYEALETKLNLPKKKITGFNQFVDYIESYEKNNQLIVKIIYPRSTVNINGNTYPFMPAYLTDILTRSSQSSISEETEVETVKIDLPYFLSDFQTTKAAVSAPAKASEKKDAGLDFDAGKNFQSPKKINLAPEVVNPAQENKSGAEAVKPAAADKEPVNAQSDDKSKKENAEAPKEKKAAPEKTEKKDQELPLSGYSIKDTEAENFLEGKLNQTAVSDAGYVCLSSPTEILWKSPGNFIYTCAYDEKSGNIMAVDQKGNIVNGSNGKTIARIDGGFVTALLSLPDGAVLAASGNKIYKVYPRAQSNASVFCVLPAQYIWQMKLRGGAVWACTGVPAAVYKIGFDGKAEKYTSVNDLHIKSFDFRKNALVMGTGESGIVYVAGADKKPVSVYQRAKNTVADIAVDGADNIYAACEEALVKIDSLGAAYVYTVSDDYITSVAVDKNNEVVFGTASGGKIYKLLADEQILLLADLQCGEVFDVNRGADGNLYFATGDPASVGVLRDGYASSGEFISRVLDAGVESLVAALDYEADIPQGTSVTVYARAGQTLKPDSGWSGWSRINGGLGKKIQGRYSQYKAALKTQNKNITPQFFGADVLYKSLYKTPVAAFLFPYTFDSLSGKQDIKWACGDTGLDVVRFNLYYASCRTGSFDPSARGIWKEIDTDIPVWLKKKEIKDDKNPLFTKQAYSWDTAKVPDGAYCLKLLAYNILDTEKSTVEAVSHPFVVCNTKPSVKIISKKNADGFLIIEGQVKCKNVLPVCVKFSFDGETWYLANPRNGVFTGAEDYFIIKAKAPKKGVKNIIIEAEDEAGNKGELKESI